MDASPSGRREISPGRMAWIGVAVAAAFWLFESAIHNVVLGSNSFRWIPEDLNELWMRSLICLLFVAFGAYAARAVSQERAARRERDRLQQELETSLTKVLSGYLPICASCKKIRDEGGDWVSPESYVEQRTAASFTHSICSECYEEIEPEDD